MPENSMEGGKQEKKEITYEEVAGKVRELKEAGIEPSGDDPRAKEVWDLIDAYAEQTGAFSGNMDASEKVALIWLENGWADDEYFRSKAIEDLTNDTIEAEEAGDEERVRHLQEKLAQLS